MIKTGYFFSFAGKQHVLQLFHQKTPHSWSISIGKSSRCRINPKWREYVSLWRWCGILEAVILVKIALRRVALHSLYLTESNMIFVAESQGNRTNVCRLR